MPKTSFTIHGISVSAYGKDASLISEFGQDFELLKDNTPADKSDIRLHIKPERPPLAVRRLLNKLFPFKEGLRLRDFGCRRLISYPEGACLLYDYSRERGFLWTEDYQLSRELAYLCALSRVGLLLDLKGLHRVHASAVRLNGRTALICGPSGCGKSTLALLLALDHNAALYSDDFPLADSAGGISPFPARPAIGEDNCLAQRGLPHRTMQRRKFGSKLLLEVPGQKNPSPAQADFVILLNRNRTEKATLRRTHRMTALTALLKHLVLGLGLPQIAELLLSLSPSGNMRLVKIALLRARAAWRLAKHAHSYRLSASASPEDAAKLIAELLRR